MLLTLFFTCLTFNGLSEFAISVYDSMFSSPNACLIAARVYIALFLEICTKSDAVFCWIHHEIASGQIYDSK
jgi:hypothetical protein